MSASSESEDYFDTVIGHIEDFVISDEFQKLVQNFMQTYYKEFNECEENRIEYTEIFNQYTNALESCIVGNLEERMPNFSMERFSEELSKRKTQLDGEIFELLFSLTDFLAFKELILDYKLYKENHLSDLDSGIQISRLSNSLI
ncbi:ADP-ribosylation factor-like protein 2-binding protein [Phlebotomus argentipes]|uniref:ADP-ribosylation factor-like protein 2-binding protein n=1 Tax=Phlebotomus argentipes TaxID=94469 RepID=UPI002892A280|nr:ADP-ribosylation factor-like protein 2-binding protein [Phlebotomus argentipes]